LISVIARRRKRGGYRLEEPFAGVDGLSPGKGLRRLQKLLDLDPLDVCRRARI
jgi:hypothetical protein